MIRRIEPPNSVLVADYVTAVDFHLLCHNIIFVVIVWSLPFFSSTCFKLIFLKLRNTEVNTIQVF